VFKNKNNNQEFLEITN
jgi:midasin